MLGQATADHECPGWSPTHSRGCQEQPGGQGELARSGRTLEDPGPIARLRSTQVTRKPSGDTRGLADSHRRQAVPARQLLPEQVRGVSWQAAQPSGAGADQNKLGGDRPPAGRCAT